MRIRGEAAFVFLCLAGAANLARASGSPLAERLAEQWGRGNRDSCLALLQEDRSRVPPVIVGWTAARLHDLAQGRLTSADHLFRNAVNTADLYAEAFGDSFYIRLCDHYREVPPDRLLVLAAGWTAYREALSLYDAYQISELKERLPGLSARVETAKDPYLELFALRLIARGIIYSGGLATEARKKLEAARSLALELGDRAGALKDLGDISHTYLIEDRLDEALALLQQILEPARKTEDWRLYVFALKSIATNHITRAKLDEALAAARDGIPVAHAHGFFGYEAECWVIAANAHGMLGQIDLALAETDSARHAAQAAGNAFMELSAIIAAVPYLIQVERYSEALALLHEGLPMAEKVGHGEAILLLNTEIGEVYQRVGRMDAALRQYEEMLPIVQRMQVPRDLCSVLRNIGLVRLDLGDKKGAVQAFESALAAVEGFPVRTQVMEASLDLGRSYLAIGDLPRAVNVLARAQALADSIANPYLIAEVDLSRGNLAVLQGHPERALACFDRAIATGRAHRTSALLREALVEKARLLMNQGDREAVDRLLAEALDVVESVRGKQAGEALRVGFLTDKKHIAVLRVGLLHALGRDEEAFRVAENARARALLDLLAGSISGAKARVDSTLAEKERRLAARLSSLQEEIARAVAEETWEETRVDSLEKRRLDTAHAYRQVIEEISVQDPGFAALASSRPPLSVRDVRSRVLDPDQILLEYLVGDSTTTVFLLGPDRFRVITLPEGETSLASQVAAFRTAINAGDARAVQSAHDLYARILEPVAADLPPGARLLVVPDGPLFHLPFAALHDGTSFLIERHAVAYAPSAGVLDAEPATKRRKPDQSLLAVGNPASYRSAVLLAETRDGSRWRFGELPYAEEEARRAAARFRRRILLLGRDATEDAVKGSMSGANYIHLATHAFASEEEPLLSGFVLAEDQGSGEDGFLQAHEILKLPLSADLVVLSACNTGLGSLAGGEGVLGLTRTFLYAGARSVLLTLWEVPDRSTLGIMDTFYREDMKEGLSFDRSLREAQLASIHEGGSIREWAPFAIMGRMDRLSPRGPKPSIAWILVIAVLLLFSTLWVLRYKRRIMIRDCPPPS